MNKVSPIIFFGNERLATGVSTDVPVFHSLLRARLNVSALVINEKRTKSRTVREFGIKAAVKHFDIPVIQVDNVKDLADELRDFNPGLGVLVAFGKIVPSKVLELFPLGIVNIHPSLLPKYRGPTPIEQAILDGADETGVSLMKLVPKMDAGPVYAQARLKLVGDESKQALADQLSKLGAELLAEHLSGIFSGELLSKDQDESQATYTKLLSKEMGRIDWQRPAKELERQVRAYAGWPTSYTNLTGRDVILTHVTVVNQTGKAGKWVESSKNLMVYCGENALIINKLKPAGGNEMSGQAFISGIKN